MLYRDEDVETESERNWLYSRPRLTLICAVPIERIHCDEESLPFEEDSHDAIMSCLSLHWVNDLPGQLHC